MEFVGCGFAPAVAEAVLAEGVRDAAVVLDAGLDAGAAVGLCSACWGAGLLGGSPAPAGWSGGGGGPLLSCKEMRYASSAKSLSSVASSGSAGCVPVPLHVCPGALPSTCRSSASGACCGAAEIVRTLVLRLYLALQVASFTAHGNCSSMMREPSEAREIHKHLESTTSVTISLTDVMPCSAKHTDKATVSELSTSDDIWKQQEQRRRGSEA